MQPWPLVGLSSDKLWRMTTAGAGSITTTGTFKSGWFTTAQPNIGPTSTAAMYGIGLLLQVGDNDAANGPVTVLREQATMANPRQSANATVLPGGRVVVTGGTRFADNAGGGAVHPAEIWNPASGRGLSRLPLGGDPPAERHDPVDRRWRARYRDPPERRDHDPPYLFRTQNGAAPPRRP